MRTGNQIIYLTFDGILNPLAYSQVVRPVISLARRGYRYTICSLEREEALERSEDVQALRDNLRQAGVEWLHGTYRAGPLGIARNMASMGWLARRAVEPSTRLVHARSYLGGAIALGLASLGIPYLFDIRSYWVDERGEEGRWFNTPARMAFARKWERAMYARASACVSLTELAAEDVRSGRFGPWGDRPSRCIPTLADFEEFGLHHRERARPPELAGKIVVAQVGGLNIFYPRDAMVEVVRRALDLSDDVVFLGLTHPPDALRDTMAAGGVPSNRMVLTSAKHVEMPRWLGWTDWGLLLLGNQASKRAAMPTKLGEFFAAGVRPLHHGCNPEVGDWVQRAGTGVSVASLDGDDLDRLARAIATPRDPSELADGRAIAREHFSLEAGIDEYAELLLRLGCAPVNADVDLVAQ